MDLLINDHTVTKKTLIYITTVPPNLYVSSFLFSYFGTHVESGYGSYIKLSVFCYNMFVNRLNA